MTREELLTKVHEIKVLEAQKKNLEESIDSLKNEIKADMDARNVTEDEIDIFKIHYTDVVSNKFDTTRFKKEHQTMYEKYLKSSVSKRFTINS